MATATASENTALRNAHVNGLQNRSTPNIFLKHRVASDKQRKI
jgi:hypothetical protein